MRYVIFFLLVSVNIYSQSDFEKTLKVGEVLVSGLSIFRNGRSDSKSSYSNTIESVCIRDKLTEKIIFSLIGKDEEGNAQKKELVIQKDGKECVFELLKGIYIYEIVLSNKEIFKKGE